MEVWVKVWVRHVSKAKKAQEQLGSGVARGGTLKTFPANGAYHLGLSLSGQQYERDFPFFERDQKLTDCVQYELLSSRAASRTLNHK